jgi:hypothetical protein
MAYRVSYVVWTVRIEPVGDAIRSHSMRLRDREGANRLAEATRDELLEKEKPRCSCTCAKGILWGVLPEYGHTIAVSSRGALRSMMIG